MSTQIRPMSGGLHIGEWQIAVAKFDELLCAGNRWLLVVMLAIMSVLVSANVISRYMFSFSFTWVEEVTRYMMIWTTFLGCGMALRVGGHIAIDALAESVPASFARCIRALIALILAVTIVFMTVLGAQYAEFAWEQETPVLGWSYGVIYLAIPIGGVLMLLHLFMYAMRWIATGQWDRVEGFDPQALS
jgi:TRAP-type C4-dicarboxylate transport system permease small subunit